MYIYRCKFSLKGAHTLKYMYMELTERSASTDKKFQELTECPGGGWGHSMKLCACTLYREVMP